MEKYHTPPGVVRGRAARVGCAVLHLSHCNDCSERSSSSSCGVGLRPLRSRLLLASSLGQLSPLGRSAGWRVYSDSNIKGNERVYVQRRKHYAPPCSARETLYTRVILQVIRDEARRARDAADATQDPDSRLHVEHAMAACRAELYVVPYVHRTCTCAFLLRPWWCACQRGHSSPTSSAMRSLRRRVSRRARPAACARAPLRGAGGARAFAAATSRWSPCGPRQPRGRCAAAR